MNNAFTNILVAYKVENGFMRKSKILEYSSSYSALEYILESERYDTYKKNGYELVELEEIEE